MEKAIEMIVAQQAAVKKGSAPWCVGEQLKDIIRTTPGAAELVAQDLTVKDMGIVECEKKIADFARQNRTGNAGFCGPADADRIIREFYGLPRADLGEVSEQNKTPAEITRKTISLLDFM